MAKVVIVGGHGKVSLLAEPLLVEAGYEVDAIIRKEEQSDAVRATGANPVVLDIEDATTKELITAFSGADAVVWSAGAGGGSPARTYAVDRDAASRAVEAANEAGVERFVMVSWFGSGPDHGADPSDGFWHYAEAKYAADRYVQARARNWTILGPSRLTEQDGTGRVQVDDPVGSVEGAEVSRSNVAAMIVGVLQRPDTAGKRIEFNDGDVPVGQALDALVRETV